MCHGNPKYSITDYVKYLRHSTVSFRLVETFAQVLRAVNDLRGSSPFEFGYF